MLDVRHLTRDELVAGLDSIRGSPTDRGVVELIVRRPTIGGREVLEEGFVDEAHGLVGDSWSVRGSSRTSDGPAQTDTQLNIMNSRVIALVARDRARWPLAGDQLYVDFDLSEANIPPGTRLAVGTAVVEISAKPHTGCRKFLDRFGSDATRFVNSPVGRALRLRGVNARVVQAGSIRLGDVISKAP
jgi:MOSC domain-containing protein